MEGKLVGRISHYFSKIGVAVVELNADLKVGDTIAIVGKAGRVEQPVTEMQVDRAAIKAASSGQSVGLKVGGRVHEGDSVFKVS